MSKPLGETVHKAVGEAVRKAVWVRLSVKLFVRLMKLMTLIKYNIATEAL